ncbi:hypothetical protein Tdes44962_MAKER00043 [Teratosphaeria destructans]|uniref:Uncharacterized protein n=1 Tax=Teratosphaeria destructans TaxID=418781 RepID=A0A9W7T2E4_9PEZI|nr:hypothetical protein Tdes44962_MAKER00043 [Teratosphaeria destructans]
MGWSSFQRLCLLGHAITPGTPHGDAQCSPAADGDNVLMLRHAASQRALGVNEEEEEEEEEEVVVLLLLLLFHRCVGDQY